MKYDACSTSSNIKIGHGITVNITLKVLTFNIAYGRGIYPLIQQTNAVSETL
jgi:hypothetical protein